MDVKTPAQVLEAIASIDEEIEYHKTKAEEALDRRYALCESLSRLKVVTEGMQYVVVSPYYRPRLFGVAKYADCGRVVVLEPCLTADQLEWEDSAEPVAAGDLDAPDPGPETVGAMAAQVLDRESRANGRDQPATA